MKSRDLIIAAVLAAIFGAIFEIWNPLRAVITKNSANGFIKLLNIQISLWVVIASILVFILSYFLSKKLLHSTKERNQERKEDDFIRDNKFIRVNDDVSARTDIYFDEEHEVHLNYIHPYCTKHSFKIKMVFRLAF